MNTMATRPETWIGPKVHLNLLILLSRLLAVPASISNMPKQPDQRAAKHALLAQATHEIDASCIHWPRK
jgi:uncharacterized SAM-binding protein YcdF (DUF218 family)